MAASLDAAGPFPGSLVTHIDGKSWILPFSTFENNIFLHFLSVYGGQGVLLRELVMLVSALDLPPEAYVPIATNLPVATFCRYPHWSHSGQREVADLPVREVLFWKFLQVFAPKCLQPVEKKFVHFGAVTVKDVDQSSPNIGQDWVTDSRSWCVESDRIYNRVDETKFCQELLAIYSQMPDKDVHPLAERYREIFYYHAHVAIKHIFRLISKKEVDLDIVGEQFDRVALQVFSHRCQQEDEEMMEFVKDRTARYSQSNIPLYFERRVMLQLVEFKATESQQTTQPGDPKMKTMLRAAMTLIHEVIREQDFMSYKAWGMVGYALAELLNTTERVQDKESFDEVVRLARKWCDKALISRTPIERAALCCVLVTLRALDELIEMPQENHLSCGYYLARTGSLRLADYFISSGIRYYEQNEPEVPIWRYHVELWTVRIRLGQWKEAEHWLSMTWETLSKRSNELSRDKFDVWKRSGELGEFRLLIGSLLSDCYIAKGNFVEARKIILIVLGTIRLMRDAFIRSTRIALKSRLLNVQSQLQEWYNASATAIDLSRELQEREHVPHEWQTISWTIQEILAFVNELVHEERYTNAYHVLCELRRLSKDDPGVSPDNLRASRGHLPDDLIADIDQRWNEVKPMKSIQESNRKSAPSGDFPLPEMTSDEIQPPITKVASPITSESGRDMKDRGYTFPPPSRVKATPVQKSMVPSPHTHLEQEKVSHNLLRKGREFWAKSRFRRHQTGLGTLPEPPENNPSRPVASKPLSKSEIPPSPTA